jgi:hypothetical protein
MKETFKLKLKFVFLDRGLITGFLTRNQPLSRHSAAMNSRRKKNYSAVSQPSAVSAAPQKKTAEHTAEYKMAQNS